MSRIKIFSHKDGDRVSYKEEVSGLVIPETTPLMLLVYSRDQRWYYQHPVVKQGNMWTCDVFFGVEDVPRGSEYVLVIADMPDSPKPAGPLEDFLKGASPETILIEVTRA